MNSEVTANAVEVPGALEATNARSRDILDMTGRVIATVAPIELTERKAYMALFAASPDLLTALQRAVAGYWGDSSESERARERENWPEHWVFAAEQAIARATGSAV